MPHTKKLPDRSDGFSTRVGSTPVGCPGFGKAADECPVLDEGAARRASDSVCANGPGEHIERTDAHTDEDAEGTPVAGVEGGAVDIADSPAATSLQG